mgnify:CR=1 FL=1|jgi:hypothetical protein
MYKTIVNPETGRKVSIHGKTGQNILRNYYNQYGGEWTVPLIEQMSNKIANLFKNPYTYALERGYSGDMVVMMARQPVWMSGVLQRMLIDLQNKDTWKSILSNIKSSVCEGGLLPPLLPPAVDDTVATATAKDGHKKVLTFITGKILEISDRYDWPLNKHMVKIIEGRIGDIFTYDRYMSEWARSSRQVVERNQICSVADTRQQEAEAGSRHPEEQPSEPVVTYNASDKSLTIERGPRGTLILKKDNCIKFTRHIYRIEGQTGKVNEEVTIAKVKTIEEDADVISFTTWDRIKNSWRTGHGLRPERMIALPPFGRAGVSWWKKIAENKLGHQPPDEEAVKVATIAELNSLEIFECPTPADMEDDGWVDIATVGQAEAGVHGELDRRLGGGRSHKKSSKRRGARKTQKGGRRRSANKAKSQPRRRSANKLQRGGRRRSVRKNSRTRR